jgi:hypothetical protein
MRSSVLRAIFLGLVVAATALHLPLAVPPGEGETIDVARRVLAEASGHPVIGVQSLVAGDSLRKAIAAATGEIRIDADAESPWIDIDGEPRIVVPQAYAAALSSYDPEFRPWNMRPYPEWILDVDPLVPTARQAPFAVIGDLNGDGRLDLVIDGRGAGYIARVVLMTEGSEVRVLEHARRALPAQEAVYKGGFGEAIRLVEPGTYESYFDQPTLELERDAFEWLFLEKAAVIVYWREGEFREWISAD